MTSRQRHWHVFTNSSFTTAHRSKTGATLSALSHPTMTTTYLKKGRYMRYVFHHFIEGSGGGGGKFFLWIEKKTVRSQGKCMKDGGMVLPTPHHLEKGWCPVKKIQMSNVLHLLYPEQSILRGCILMHALFCCFPLFSREATTCQTRFKEHDHYTNAGVFWLMYCRITCPRRPQTM